ncbi:efflux RND transporter periplasmic adaptor subunit [Mucilaginibacter sp. BJC16-A38]|uniref:efflux RND transporter periplasmic adaptor subunit n=1 Tax=Mucilaginibacter phenanthrenivorans TaxID=1234842 RepID=UPI002158786C|nr:efflux RND transporter periplasmic adaptor subunit [Mucilaginibacter phenanthrenivorans]MCR8556312.1 efflux RND transporter periplasmic adaptor subunit [Mucilaginibacter phenanthrenivorans]
MKPIIKKILIIAVILIVVVLIWFLFLHKKDAPIVIQAEKPDTGYIAQSVTATGKIEPVDTVTVGTQVSGIIKYLYVDFNSKVKKGQLLAELDKTLLQAALDQYKGSLLNAQSQQVFAKNNFDRQNLLFKTDAISKADYDSALNTYNAAKANVKSAQAQVNSAQKNLSYADIYSPIDGVVLNRNIAVGQTVAASFSTPTLFIIAKDITKMEVEANVDEADIGDVKAGNRASFTVDAFINDSFGGTVEDIRLHPSVSANVVTYTTIINAPNKDEKLKPGMTANIIIYTKEVNGAMLIPAKALAFTPDSSLAKDYEIIGKVPHKKMKKGSAASGGDAGANQLSHTAKSRNDSSGITKQHATVWLLQGKKLVQKRITIGLNDNTHVEVLSGLATSDLVITGVTGGAAGKAGAATTPGASPFLPQRRGGGGGGGGGGGRTR